VCRPRFVDRFTSGAQRLRHNLAAEETVAPRIARWNRDERVGPVGLEMQQIPELDVIDSLGTHRDSLTASIGITRIARRAT
jgi:hypothetical protein